MADNFIFIIWFFRDWDSIIQVIISNLLQTNLDFFGSALNNIACGPVQDQGNDPEHSHHAQDIRRKHIALSKQIPPWNHAKNFVSAGVGFQFPNIQPRTVCITNNTSMGQLLREPGNIIAAGRTKNHAKFVGNIVIYRNVFMNPGVVRRKCVTFKAHNDLTVSHTYGCSAAHGKTADRCSL